jgi:hypothetical protein
MSSWKRVWNWAGFADPSPCRQHLSFFHQKAKEVNAPGEDPGLHPIQDYCYLNVHVIQD